MFLPLLPTSEPSPHLERYCQHRFLSFSPCVSSLLCSLLYDYLAQSFMIQLLVDNVDSVLEDAVTAIEAHMTIVVQDAVELLGEL